MFKNKKTPNKDIRQKPVTNTNAPVFSYYSNRSQPAAQPQTSSRSIPANDSLKNKKHIAVLGYIPAILSLVIVFIAFTYITTLNTDPRIVISASDSSNVAVQSTDVYQQAAASILKSSVYNRSKLTIDSDKIAEQLKDKFPELGEMAVTVPLISRRPIITIQPATPAAILVGPNKSLVIDSYGRAVLDANLLNSGAADKIPTVKDDSITQDGLGKQVLSTDTVSFITDLNKYLTANNINVESYYIPEQSNEVHVYIAGKPYYIKFTADSDARVGVGSYLALNQKLEADNITPAEYIDLRVDERAYYK